MNSYRINPRYGISLEGQVIKPEIVSRAAELTNEYFKIRNTPEDICFFSASMEGGALSSSIGSVFNKNLVALSNGSLALNPVKGGNPDILNLSLDAAKSDYRDYTYNKNGKVLALCPDEFGYKKKYEYGGIETKSTMFTKPSKWGLVLDYGDPRIFHSIKFSWGAHHNDNSNLLGIVWDFVNGLPCIVAVMYSELDVEDWGNPNKIEGNKSTNGYNLTKAGVEKMRNGWLCVLNNEDYINRLDFQMYEGDIEMIPEKYRPKKIGLW